MTCDQAAAMIRGSTLGKAADWAGFSAKANEFIAEGDRVVALGTYSGTSAVPLQFAWRAISLRSW
jgi:hypothetical protein